MDYHDFTLEAFDYESTAGEPVARFKLRLAASPAGEMPLDQALSVEFDQASLAAALTQLRQGGSSLAGLAELGGNLASILFPAAGSAPAIRDFYHASRDALPQGDGLRLRLGLPAELAVFPWEYLYLDRRGAAPSESTGLSGFLVLDPRISIVRHEQLAAPVLPTAIPGDIRLLVALASPPYLDPFDLKNEQAVFQAALAGQAGIQPAFIQNAALADLATNLPNVDVFHFIGHGKFIRRRDGAPGFTGAIALDDTIVGADELVVYLQAVRLAVLGGCETARRDAANANSGIASALARAGVPCVLGNQFLVGVKTASAFNAAFYRALAGGLSIEQAASAGRLAAYAADPAGGDWGAPALYLRGARSALFAGASDPGVRQSARQEAEVSVELNAAEVTRVGSLIGAEVGEMSAGRLNVHVRIAGSVSGQATGAQIDSVSGGEVKIKTEAERVEDGGKVTGLKLGKLG